MTEHEHEPSRTYRWPDLGLYGATCRHCHTDYTIEPAAIEGLRKSTMGRLDAILVRLENPSANLDLDTRTGQYKAVYLNLQILKGIGFWEELNTYFTLFQDHLRKRGEL